MIDDVEVVWQKPENAKGVVLLFHGCSHSAGDFWPDAFYCRGCLGLPEEMSEPRGLGRGLLMLLAADALMGADGG